MKKQRFTIIELLTVIAILAAIASLLQPSLVRTLRHARQIVCSNHLSKIQQAEEIAIQEGSEDIPAGVYIPHRIYTTERSQARSRNMRHWPGVLSNYLGSDYQIGIYSEFEVPKSFQCPDDEVMTPTGRGIINTISYGLNGSIGWQYSRNNLFTYKDLVPNPSELVMFADSDRNERLDYNIQGTNHVWAYPGFIHDNRALVIFADMHVEHLHDFEMTGLGKLQAD